MTVHLVFKMLLSGQATKHITASINGRQLGEFAAPTTGAAVAIDVAVPAALVPADGIMPLRLQLDHPESPASLGSNDPRELSELMQTIEISR